MTTIRELFDNPDVDSVVVTATKTIHRRYKRWVGYSDLKQELWLWLCANPTKAQALLDKSEATLLYTLRDVASNYARKEKAGQSGYEPDDECHYSLERVAELLPDAFDPDATSPQVGVTDTPTARSEMWMEWETGVVDVRRALDRISSPLYATLRARHVDGRQVDPGEYRAALRAVQRVLGGPRPRAGLGR